jgi:hypothetical protein
MRLGRGRTVLCTVGGRKSVVCDLGEGKKNGSTCNFNNITMASESFAKNNLKKHLFRRLYNYHNLGSRLYNLDI